MPLDSTDLQAGNVVIPAILPKQARGCVRLDPRCAETDHAKVLALASAPHLAKLLGRNLHGNATR
jgi:hypothetical protein